MTSLPRFYLGPKVQKTDAGMGYVCAHDCFLEDDSGYTRSYGGNCHQQLQLMPSFHHSNIRCSTPIKEDEKILALQQEMQKLQAMVHELWMCHQVALSSNCEQTVVTVSCGISSSASSSPVIPPLPPPPPPPPLPFSLTAAPTICKMSQTTNLCPTECKGQTVFSLGDILKDIAKVKLRPVERSPGGNPKRRPLTPCKPSSDLTAALKKRFAAMHSETPTPQCCGSVGKGSNSQFDLDMMETCKTPIAVKLFA